MSCMYLFHHDLELDYALFFLVIHWTRIWRFQVSVLGLHFSWAAISFLSVSQKPNRMCMLHRNENSLFPSKSYFDGWMSIN